MPTYEYACEACANQWEEVQRITEAPTEVCPKCGKSSAHRLISTGGGFILKGGGWYSDLYSSAKPPSNKAEANGTTSTDAASTTATTGASTTESATKTEVKTETKAPAATPPASSTPTSSSS